MAGPPPVRRLRVPRILSGDFSGLPGPSPFRSLRGFFRFLALEFSDFSRFMHACSNRHPSMQPSWFMHAAIHAAVHACIHACMHAACVTCAQVCLFTHRTAHSVHCACVNMQCTMRLRASVLVYAHNGSQMCSFRALCMCHACVPCAQVHNARA